MDCNTDTDEVASRSALLEDDNHTSLASIAPSVDQAGDCSSGAPRNQLRPSAMDA